MSACSALTSRPCSRLPGSFAKIHLTRPSATVKRVGLVTFARTPSQDALEEKEISSPSPSSSSSPVENAEENGQGSFSSPSFAGAALSAAFIASVLFAATPDEALAARSGGRVGGSSFSSRPRAAPRAAPRSGPSYNFYSAPPLVSPYGGYGFGLPFFGGGIVAPMPFFGIGAIFNIMIVLIIVNVVLTTIRNFTNGNDRRNDDSWDDDGW